MQTSNIPTKFPIPFADAAGPTYVRDVPVTSQIGVTDGAASLTDGFPPLTFTPEASGGVPPFGQDTNGLLRQITQWTRWNSAGGQVPFDAAFSTAIGGYPKGAEVASATQFGVFYVSLVENNTSNPDTGGAGWKAFTPYGGPADYYDDSGAANALAITPKPPLAAYADGVTFAVAPGHANTAASTLAVNGLGAIPIVHRDGSALIAGEIQAGQVMRLVYHSGAFQWVNAPYAQLRGLNDGTSFPASTAYADRAAATAVGMVDVYGGAIYGLTMVNTPSFLTTRITAAVGACRDAQNTTPIALSAPMTKDLTAPWAAGDGAGGRLTSTALAAGQTWHEFILLNSSTGVVDLGFDQSPTAPHLPTGFDKYRRIGAVILEASGTGIRQFTQTADCFSLAVRSTDFASTANGGAPFYRAVTVPYGIRCLAEFYFQSVGSADASIYLSGVYDPADGTPAFGSSTQFAQIRRTAIWAYPGVWSSYGTTMVQQFSDTTAHVYTASNDVNDIIALGVKRWWDPRGRYYLP